MIVFVNTHAAGGRALSAWKAIRSEVADRCGPFTEVEMSDDVSLRDQIGAALESGERHFVAAGGDGTVNRLACALLESGAVVDHDGPRLGAIALGSSNDFHKPRQAARILGEVPCRLDFKHATPVDIGRLTCADESGLTFRRHWLLNASVGITAEANDGFNHPDRVLRRLKRISTQTAILYAALYAIRLHADRRVSLSIDAGPSRLVNCTNLAILKSPHCSGFFRYDVPHQPTSGRFHFCLCHDMTRFDALAALCRLACHRLLPSSTVRFGCAERLEVDAPGGFAVEFDGEVVRTRHAIFDIHHDQLEVCP